MPAAVRLRVDPGRLRCAGRTPTVNVRRKTMSPPVVSDALLNRIASGDMAAMQACIDQYSGLVYSLARRLVGNPAEIEDAVQEVFISLWENAGRFDPGVGAEVTFVAMIARRRLIDRGRRLQRDRRLIEQLKERETGITASGRDGISLRDESAFAAKALGKLSPEQQRVLKLAIHYGLTHEQIAHHTELPLGTVKTHARRGLQRVRENLREHDLSVRVEIDS
jgi:RNA polymerase sigma-70 factor (ECF subfamily)